MTLRGGFRVAPLLLALGACGGGGGGGGGGGPTVSFALDILPLFVQDCTLCHGGAGAGGLNLESHAGVMAGGNSGAAVLPGDPDNSFLVKRVEGTVLPQMPLGGSPLTGAEIGRIRQWIFEGALNN